MTPDRFYQLFTPGTRPHRKRIQTFQPLNNDLVEFITASCSYQGSTVKSNKSAGSGFKMCSLERFFIKVILWRKNHRRINHAHFTATSMRPLPVSSSPAAHLHTPFLFFPFSSTAGERESLLHLVSVAAFLRQRDTVANHLLVAREASGASDRVFRRT